MNASDWLTVVSGVISTVGFVILFRAAPKHWVFAALDGYLLITDEERAAAFCGENLHFVAVHFDMYHTVWGGDVALKPVKVA